MGDQFPTSDKGSYRTTKVGLMISGGVDSRVLRSMLTDPILINAPRESGIDYFAGADHYYPLPQKNKANELYARMLQAIDELELDELYVGTNMAKYEHLADRPDAPVLPDGEPHPKIRAPFWDMYKHEILQIAEDNNVDLTDAQSCIEQPDGHCGQCYNCLELEHAKSYLLSRGQVYGGDE